MPEKINRISLADDAPMGESELSTVPKGAQRQRFLLRKGDSDMPSFQIDGAVLLKMVNDGKIEDEAALDAAMEKEELTDEQKTKLKSMIRLADKIEEFPEQFKKRLGKMLGKGIMKVDDTTKVDPTDPKHRFGIPKDAKKEDGTYDLEKIDEAIRPIFEALNKEHEELKPEDAPLSKETEELKKETADLKKENVVLTKSVETLNDKITTTELRKEVEEKFNHVPGDTDEKVDLLKSMDEKGSEALRKSWGVTEEALAKSEAFMERGSGGSGIPGGDAMDQLEALGTEIRKEDTKLTKEQAFTKAMDLNPELNKQYLAERRQAQRNL